MRDRPFIPAGEQIRPFSELAAERRQLDPFERAREEGLAQIHAIEAEAAEAAAEGDLFEARRLQCEAEELRCAVDRK